MPDIKIVNNDCLIALKEFPDNHFDSCVTDPPYGISFMQKKWDYDIPSVEIWKEVLRVIKPGSHILVACGTRTQHRMAVNIEDAGFEIRDIISWIYGSGFPKSLNISKAIDKSKGLERKVVGKRKHPALKDTAKIEEPANAAHGGNEWKREWDITGPASVESENWEGWGTALKPAQELWTLARKPLSEKTIAENVLKWGTGTINIDACRIRYEKGGSLATNPSLRTHIMGGNGGSIICHEDESRMVVPNKNGRFPANVIFDEESGKLLNAQSGITKSGKVKESKGSYHGESNTKFLRGVSNATNQHGDEGGASRFFYCAKASQSERNKGLEKVDFKKSIGHNRFDKCSACGKYILQNPDRPSACACENPIREDNIVSGNHHPTVKPVNLIRYLVKMVTPERGKCLDPFAGSCTTGIALKIDGFYGVLIEREKEYCDIGRGRIDGWENELENSNCVVNNTDSGAQKEAKDENNGQTSLF